MNYKQAVDYLESLRPNEFRMELTPIAQACSHFGNPQKLIPSIHISGTNGKGSTSAFCESILRGSGYKTGLYTSPHLVDVRERIQINRKPISPDEFAKYVGKIKDEISDETVLSYFEFLTLISFLYFKDNKVDYAIYETGLGGRLDATNVLTPSVAVITSISYDHTEHLGSKLEDITREKCGIIKRAVPTVCAEQEPIVKEVILRTCDDVGSPLLIAHLDDANMKLGLDGNHQRQNASCAIQAVHLLEGIKIKDQESSLANTKWPGRLEKVMDKPKVILDGAHNPAGAKALASYIKDNFKKERTVVMLGILADKDVKEMIKHIAPLAREVICVSAPSSRASSPKDIAALVRSYGVKVFIEEKISDALKKWIGKLAKNDALFITGSLYTVGAAKEYFSKGH